MIKVKAVSVREKEELEPLLVANPEVIEDGLKIIAHQHPTDSGPLDILAVDADGTLVVIELKNEAAEGHLDQGLRYYDWCRLNISWIASAYSSKAKINTEASPRLMLVAPAFTDTVKRIAKYIEAELDLIEYHAFENEKNERGLICTTIDYGQAPVPPEIPTLEKKLDYFQSDKVKELFCSVLKELAGKQVEIKPIHELWISFWYKGKRFMYAAPRRDFFVVEVLKTDGSWSSRIRISTQKDWDQTIQQYIQKYMEYLDGIK